MDVRLEAAAEPRRALFASEPRRKPVAWEPRRGCGLTTLRRCDIGVESRRLDAPADDGDADWHRDAWGHDDFCNLQRFDSTVLERTFTLAPYHFGPLLNLANSEPSMASAEGAWVG